jgi:PAS domain S-box-containing protein
VIPSLGYRSRQFSSTRAEEWAMAKKPKSNGISELKALYDGRFEDVSAAVLVVVPPLGKIISMNVEAEDLTGYERGELEGMELAEIFREEDRARIASIFKSSTGMDFRKLFEHNVIVRKRSRRKIMVDMGFRRAGSGKDLAYVFTLQDITDLKNNEERVIRANEYVNNIINSIIEVLIVVDDSGIVQSVNSQGLQLLGYEADEVVGKELATLFPDAGSPIRQRQELSEVETRLRAKDGRLVPVLASKSQLKADRFGDTYRSVVVAMDISERKKNERLIAEQQMMIVQASKMSSLGEMASSIAHEINNPLQDRRRPDAEGRARQQRAAHRPDEPKDLQDHPRPPVARSRSAQRREGERRLPRHRAGNPGPLRATDQDRGEELRSAELRGSSDAALPSHADFAGVAQPSEQLLRRSRRQARSVDQARVRAFRPGFDVLGQRQRSRHSR